MNIFKLIVLSGVILGTANANGLQSNNIKEIYTGNGGIVSRSRVKMTQDEGKLFSYTEWAKLSEEQQRQHKKVCYTYKDFENSGFYDERIAKTNGLNINAHLEFFIPNGVTYIEEGCFSQEPSLAVIFIPDTVTKIGDNAFWSCPNLERISFPTKEIFNLASFREPIWPGIIAEFRDTQERTLVVDKADGSGKAKEVRPH